MSCPLHTCIAVRRLSGYCSSLALGGTGAIWPFGTSAVHFGVGPWPWVSKCFPHACGQFVG